MLAHRGLAVDAPENTLLAFLHALAAGATYVETDVHVSSDGVAMISHDPDLRRVLGRPERIDQLTAAQLGALELGEQQGMPTLAQALEAFPDARFNIDIKDDGAVMPTVTAIRVARANRRVLVTSFSARRTARAVRRLPGVVSSASTGQVALVVIGSRLGIRGLVRLGLGSAAALQIPERRFGIRILSDRVVRAAHRESVEVHVWVVNDPERMRALFAAGVDGIVTDRADLAVDALAR